MNTDSIIVLAVVVLALILFITEFVAVDLVALLIVAILLVFGVITPEQGFSGFSNSATITVLFMFILSSALLKTGALQLFAHYTTAYFKKNYTLGFVGMLLLVAVVSAFINNTPVVAVFIPVVIQIAKGLEIAPSKLLIPLSFASIFGGTCTLIGTSTNLLVNGIVAQNQGPELGMFTLLPIGVILLVVGIIYLALFGSKLLPNISVEVSTEQSNLKNYITELKVLPNSVLGGTKIMHSQLIKNLGIDVIAVLRNEKNYILPPGDFEIQVNDVLKVQCNTGKVKELQNEIEVVSESVLGPPEKNNKQLVWVELIVPANSIVIGKSLKEIDFRRTFRAVPLAIKHRKDVEYEKLHDVKLQAGDVILAEVKSHYIKELKKQEQNPDSSFIVVSEDYVVDFDKRQFSLVISILGGVVGLATFGVLPIATSALLGVVSLLLTKVLTTKEAYQSVNWKVVFLLAGSLSLGVAMQNTGLDVQMANLLIHQLGSFGPIAVLASLYLITAILTEVMSNNATAALIAPIALSAASVLNVSATPFIIAVTVAASASFMTPIGYQTNTMVYTAGGYKFYHFTKVGFMLMVVFWVLATLLIPIIYPF